MDRIQRWVIENTGEGNRNKQLYNFAMVLYVGGLDFVDIGARVRALNDKLADKLDEQELQATILKSIQSKGK